MYIISISCFSVRAKTRPGESLCIVGDSAMLGQWDPHNAVVMSRQTKKYVLPDKNYAECFEEFSEDG
jgi:hypothetical protein